MCITDVKVVIASERTLVEVELDGKAFKEYGLERCIIVMRSDMMCEVTRIALLAERFLEYCDGFSIGSNEMSQLTLGVDRDSGGPVAATFDERNAAVKGILHLAISACRKHNKYV
ncbi:hypothetical protein BWD07_12420, partial [Neisseria canis]